MKEIRYCENCKYCKQVKAYYNTWLECRQFNIEVAEDDYCSFGGDIPPEYEDEDKAYEMQKEKRLEE